MKKFLFFLVFATICGHANAITKCINVNAIDYGSVTDSNAVPDGTYWSVTFDSTITVEGDAICLNNSCTTEDTNGSNGCYTNSIDTYGGPEDTFYCWCRIVQPFVSKWFYLGVVTSGMDEYDDSMCRSDCTSECQAAFLNDIHGLRTNINSQISSYN